MVFTNEESLVYNYKFSSVGPGQVTGSNVVHNLTGMNLAMKLHYLKGVYFYGSEAAEGITNTMIKEAMFNLLNEYYHTCGRLRRSESGRPYIKCNDCGARFIEAKCDKTVKEWLEMEDWPLNQKLLVSQQVIGPELSFSPLLLFQLTSFRCGGFSLSLSWAHILGDTFSASDFMNKWAQEMASLRPKYSPHNPDSLNTKIENFESPTPLDRELLPLSLKQVDPLGDLWISTNDNKMEAFSFLINQAQMTNLKVKILGPFFESICALIWKSIAKIREGFEPEVVTICKRNPKRASGVLSNTQIISTVKVDFSIIEEDSQKLATLLAEQGIDETAKIEEAIEKDQGLSDFVVYGANLTFVDWLEANLYGSELQGNKPEFVSYTIQGVGENGVVLVLPRPEGSDNGGGEGRLVTVILPENEIRGLKSELRRNDLLFENYLE
ncbi:hypothetical protein UlMin_010380 [Ulmus minor]